MIFPIIFCTLIIGSLLWISITGGNAWPLSAYQMFSKRLAINDLQVFRVALENHDGTVKWWNSRFYRTPEHIGLNLKRIHQLAKEKLPFPGVIEIETKKCLLEVARLINLEEGSIDHYQSFHVVERVARITDQGTITITDNTITKVPIDTIKPMLEKS